MSTVRKCIRGTLSTDVATSGVRELLALALLHDVVGQAGSKQVGHGALLPTCECFPHRRCRCHCLIPITIFMPCQR